MDNRKEALYRLLLIVPLILLTYLGGLLGYVLYLPFFLIDIPLQLITGGDGLSPSGFVPKIYEWQVENTMFVIFGAEEWNWSP